MVIPASFLIKFKRVSYQKYRNMKEIKIAVIGLGYVGLPLARLFATKYAVVGFDINQQRVKELMAGKDSTLEVAHDPCADPKEVFAEHGVVSQKNQPDRKFDGIVLAVAHREFKDIDLKKLQKEASIIYDVKNYLSSEIVDKTL
jgi:UDP-N-acetyl-D-mannosaminuronate dehydrogenase